MKKEHTLFKNSLILLSHVQTTRRNPYNLLELNDVEAQKSNQRNEITPMRVLTKNILGFVGVGVGRISYMADPRKKA